jgi:hypothetical protein
MRWSNTRVEMRNVKISSHIDVYHNIILASVYTCIYIQVSRLEVPRFSGDVCSISQCERFQDHCLTVILRVLRKPFFFFRQSAVPCRRQWADGKITFP